MKHILLFGAGKSATVLIDYLKEISVQNNYKVTVADAALSVAAEKVGDHINIKAVQVNVEIEKDRNDLIMQADVVISMLPPPLHYLVAIDCVKFKKHLLTASYIDERIRALADEIKKNDILFLCEMGLDPGIDHMSAMQLINHVRLSGGKITSFKSHCGGLIAPESDDNPWHYKIAWNPKNIIMAGKSGAVYKENGETKVILYEELFKGENLVEVPGNIMLSYYPNRDSLPYIPLYNLEEASTFMRTTLRHPDFTFGWKNIIDLNLTNENEMYETNGMSYATFFKKHFEKFGFSDWLNVMLNDRLSGAKNIMQDLLSLLENDSQSKEGDMGEIKMMVNEKGELDSLDIEVVKDKAAASLALKMHEANLSLKQLFFLGIDSNEMINQGPLSAAGVLQFILEKKLALAPDDKDQVIMMHEVEYELDGITQTFRSTLIVTGEDSVHTAMAKTVGFPLGIAARLILEGEIPDRGLHIPISSSIYTPVLKELDRLGIKFIETLS